MAKKTKLVWGATKPITPTIKFPKTPFVKANPTIGMPGPAQAPAPPAAPAAPPASIDTWRPGAQRDSAWSTAVANINANKSGALNQIGTARSRALEDYTRNQALTEEGRGKTLGGTRNTANRQGLLYSGILSEREGDVNLDFLRRQEGLSQGQRRNEEDLSERERGVETIASQQAAAAEQAAYDRWLAQQQGAPVDETQTTPDLEAFMAALNQYMAGRKVA